MILYNGESLAYLGDAIYEVEIRKYLLKKGIQNVNKLHKLAIKFTSGEAQAKAIDYLLASEMLSSEEINFYKRGRNANHSKNRRNIDVISYHKATGFEAMIGYLYYAVKEERLLEIINAVILFIEGEINE